MKKIYSILALASFMLGAGEINAQNHKMEQYTEAEATESVAVFEGEWTAEAINEKIVNDYWMCATIDLTGVTSDLSSAMIVPENPNTIIRVVKNGDIANDINVLPVKSNRGVMNNFVLTDGYDFLSVRKFDAYTATYTRPVKNEYNTVCIPFCFKLEDQRERKPEQRFELLIKAEPDLLTFRQISSMDLDVVKGKHHVAAGTPMVVHLHHFNQLADEDKKIEIIAGPSTINGHEEKVYDEIAYKLVGTNVATEISLANRNTDLYYIQDNLFWAFEDFGTTVEVPAFRCVLKDFNVAGAESKLNIVSLGDEATSISSVATSANTEAYNLQGVRVAPNAKGFVIVNGKKTYNK